MQFVFSIGASLLMITTALSSEEPIQTGREPSGLFDDLPTYEEVHPEVSAPPSPLSEETELRLRQMIAGFNCAILASHAADRNQRMSDQMSRLLNFAYDAAKSGVPNFVGIPGFQKQLGPAGAFLASMSDDFWIGMYFQQVAIDVDKALNEHAPYDGGDSYEMIRDVRSAFASGEYQRKNCELLGR